MTDRSPRVFQRLKEWWQLRKYRKSLKELEKARLRTQIHRQQRKRIESIYPGRETLPFRVWIKEFATHCWYSIALKYYPTSWLRNRVDRT